jgi:hypothetical protein
VVAVEERGKAAQTQARALWRIWQDVIFHSVYIKNKKKKKRWLKG